MSLVAISEVSAMLAGRIDALARELLPAGRRDGHEWRCGGVDGAPGRSLGVHLSGGKAGVWADFSTGETGDALDLVAAVLFRGDVSEAFRWARQWLGLESGDPAALATRRAEAVAAADRRAEEAEREVEQTRNNAFRIWLSAQERIGGTPVEAYLRGRGIDLAALGRQPRALRFHPNLWNAETQRHWPAMVAAVHGSDGKFLAVHRTFLEVQDGGAVRKAPLQKPKLVLGVYRGGMIRLWRGASGRPLREAREGERVDITEGIEDGLSVAVCCPEARVVAAISLSNLGNLVFPPAIGGVVLWRQNDKERQAIAAFDRAVSEFRRRGLEVLIPQMPDKLKDVNDLVRVGAREAVA